MGKITEALRKAADDRLHRIEKISKVKEQEVLIIKKMEGSHVDPRIITYFDPKALITEQYKILRTNVLSLNQGKPPKAIVITSSIHSEGKTITAINLAMAVAQSVQKPKVLLIDADLRRGRLNKYLGVSQKTGLSEVLSGNAELGDALFKIDMDNLSFISSGAVPDNPAELLGSEQMRRLLADVKTQFDHVFIDTPPIISVTDSGIVGPLADGVILVVQAGRTQRGIVKRATELLQQTRAKLLGHVLTNIEYHLPEYIYRYL
ncbi:MAG: CpsD/CapB family tyrosine-protein kinase [Candidatus Omnitrophota bacterium]|nr:CpsD/CapB family tyrosine-protein kinase [Candidatus Omnitrophota bacterium]MDZ4241200.1 CpsD/CapB family tyrosine-protein kinase [Candidatus Omnitrophota bacterium]